MYFEVMSGYLKTGKCDNFDILDKQRPYIYNKLMRRMWKYY